MLFAVHRLGVPDVSITSAPGFPGAPGGTFLFAGLIRL